MNSKIDQKFWLFPAICFIIAGLIGKNTLFIILGCSFICIGFAAKRKKTKDKEDEEK